MIRKILLLPLLLLTVPLHADEPSIATIMSRDFVGTSPSSPRFSADGRALFYELRRPGTEIVDSYRLDLSNRRSKRLEGAALAELEPARFVESRDHKWRAFVRDGDLFLLEAARGRMRQVTRTSERESEPQILLDGRLAFWRGDELLAFDPASGLTASLAALRFADDPDAEKPKGYYERQQLRYFTVLREAEERREAAKAVDEASRAADPSRSPKPWFFGKGQSRLGAALSPDGRYLAVVFGTERDRSEDDEQGADRGKSDKLAGYVNESGYVEIREVRPKVGTGKPETPKLAVLDLVSHERRDVDFSALPGLADDPLADLRAAAAAAKAAPGDAPRAPGEQQPRVLALRDLAWSPDGGVLAVQLFSYDNKDRWLATVDGASGQLTPLERTSDPAWINWRFNDFGWMRGRRELWYLSEESGFSQLYLRPLDGEKRQLTEGRFEIDTPALSRDGKSFLVTANREHPGIVEVYRVDAASGALTRLTERDGLVDSVAISPDGKQIAYLASGITSPPELFVQAATAGAATQVTDTAAAPFRAVEWARPEVVAVPSTHGAGRIWARVYTPPGWQADASYPAVAFVHGAGYLQNVHYGWSDYLHEFMFHTLLTRRGYVVLDMDYRASSGYGREWRTAIYRQMGWPEVEDYEDGVAWLVANKGVDPKRVGVYGGSYGGFFTFMAMFNHPDLFAAGAALRPVSDWAHYNHGYTSNILNTPEVDPEAFKKSSPIEYAAGLARPLLICHGMVDDNVTFQDTARLVQRLIELGKTSLFETAIYPVERHSFTEPTSWTDEYTRIWNLFERALW